MKKKPFILFPLLACCAVVLIISGFSKSNSFPKQPGGFEIGAYYFDGWTGKTQGTITPFLTDSFTDRKPQWGWITSTPEAMAQQIDLAADHGLSFFDFCWYYPDKNHNDFENDPLNHALGLFLAAPNKEKLKFCLMVANHEGNIIGKDDWSKLVPVWIKLFKSDRYLRVNGKPYITFFSAATMVQRFGSPAAVKAALDSFRTVAANEGLGGITISACTSTDTRLTKLVTQCGFDALTGYNYHTGALQKNAGMSNPISQLRKSDVETWDSIATNPLPFIPAATLNWDARPWVHNAASPKYSHFTGYSTNSVETAVDGLIKWMKNNPGKTYPEKVALLYAWNEYGEGGWLTPSESKKDSLLMGVKLAIDQNKNN